MCSSFYSTPRNSTWGFLLLKNNIYNMNEQLFIQKTGLTLKDYITQFKTRNVFYIKKYNLNQDIDDTLQTYYIFLLNKIKYFDSSKSSFLTFNHLVLQTHLKLLFRKVTSPKNLTTVHFEVFPDDFIDEVEQTTEEKLNLVYELLNSKIKELDKNIFLDRYLKQLTNEQLCEKYNLSQQQIKNRLHQTLKKLKQNI